MVGWSSLNSKSQLLVRFSLFSLNEPIETRHAHILTHTACLSPNGFLKGNLIVCRARDNLSICYNSEVGWWTNVSSTRNGSYGWKRFFSRRRSFWNARTQRIVLLYEKHPTVGGWDNLANYIPVGVTQPCLQLFKWKPISYLRNSQSCIHYSWRNYWKYCIASYFFAGL